MSSAVLVGDRGGRSVDASDRATCSASPVFRTVLVLVLRVFGPGEGDAEVGEDYPLDLVEPVEDEAGFGVGDLESVEGGERGAGGRFGGSAFWEDAREGDSFAECSS